MKNLATVGWTTTAKPSRERKSRSLAKCDGERRRQVILPTQVRAPGWEEVGGQDHFDSSVYCYPPMICTHFKDDFGWVGDSGSPIQVLTGPDIA